MSAKGTHWSKNQHKYLRIENGRYIYDEPNPDGDNSGSSFDVNNLQNTGFGKAATKFLAKGQESTVQEYTDSLYSFQRLSEGEQINQVLNFARSHDTKQMLTLMNNVNIWKYDNVEDVATKCYMQGLTPDEAKFVCSVYVGKDMAEKEIKSYADQAITNVKKEVSNEIAGIKKKAANAVMEKPRSMYANYIQWMNGVTDKTETKKPTRISKETINTVKQGIKKSVDKKTTAATNLKDKATNDLKNIVGQTTNKVNNTVANYNINQRRRNDIKR